MVINNIILAFRQLRSNKIFSIINVLGLAFSMIACLLIYKYVNFEKSFDNYHSEVENIYRLYRFAESPSDDRSIASIFPAIAPNIKANVPEVESATRFIGSEKLFQSFAFSYAPTDGEVRTFNISRGYFADPDALDIFSLNWVEGDGQVSLSNPNELIISESIAKRFFGNESALGKFLEFKNMERQYKVTGVYQDLPSNTHFKFDLLCSFASLPKAWGLDNDYGWGNFYTYLRLSDGADLENVYTKVNDFLRDKREWYAEEGITFEFQSIEDIHLGSNLTFEIEPSGNARTVSFLSIIGVFIMVIAWVNYINLSTSKLVDRGKEVGVRKVLGGHRVQLIRQFLTESLVVNLIAIVLALTLLQSTISFFEALLGIPMTFFTSESLPTTLIFIFGFSLGALIFGLYPALLFSKQKVTQVLKGKSKTSRSGLMLRKSLMIFQFAIALVLIIGTVSVFQQLRYMQNQSLGMDIEQTLVVKKPFTDSLSRVVSHNSFMNQVNQLSNVNGISATSEVPGSTITRMRSVNTMADGSGDGVYAKDISVDEHFLDVYGLKLLHGSDFNESNRRNSFMLNESAAKDLFGNMDFDSQINKTFYYLGRQHQLIGIIGDFSQESLKNSTEAHIYSSKNRVRFYSTKLAGGAISESLDKIEKAFNLSFPASHFDYFFLDEYFNRQYKSDRLFGEIFTFFSVLAVVITSLGLFGLSLYNISQRGKEISIRKVLGASIKSISLLLSREYFLLMLMAAIIAMPLGFLMIDQWLSGFAYRMPIGAILFITPFLIITMLTLISVGYQVLKAALQNPANSLRYE